MLLTSKSEYRDVEDRLKQALLSVVLVLSLFEYRSRLGRANLRGRFSSRLLIVF